MAELADHDGWELLIQLADSLGHNQLAERFRQALSQEETHLRDVRLWLTQLAHAEAND